MLKMIIATIIAYGFILYLLNITRSKEQFDGYYPWYRLPNSIDIYNKVMYKQKLWNIFSTNK